MAGRKPLPHGLYEMQFMGAGVAYSVRSRGGGLDGQDLMHMFWSDVTGKAVVGYNFLCVCAL